MADLLVDDHAELAGLLSDLLTEFDRGDADGALAKLDLLWARLAMHIRAEHLHLFPTLLNAPRERRGGAFVPAPSPEEVRAAVLALREDHDFFMRELAAGVNALRALVALGGDPEPGDSLSDVKRRVVAVCERLGEHNRLEEEKVYLWQNVLLSEGERDALLALMRRELENLPPRFKGAAPN